MSILKWVLPVAKCTKNKNKAIYIYFFFFPVQDTFAENFIKSTQHDCHIHVQKEQPARVMTPKCKNLNSKAWKSVPFYFYCVVYCLMNITSEFTFHLAPPKSLTLVGWIFYDVISQITFDFEQQGIWQNYGRKMSIRGSNLFGAWCEEH